MAFSGLASAIDTSSQPPAFNRTPANVVATRTADPVHSPNPNWELESGVASFVDDGSPTLWQGYVHQPSPGLAHHSTSRVLRSLQAVRKSSLAAVPAATDEGEIHDENSPLEAPRYAGKIKPISGDLLRRLYKATQDEKYRTAKAAAHQEPERAVEDITNATQFRTNNELARPKGFHLPRSLIKAVRERERLVRSQHDKSPEPTHAAPKKEEARKDAFDAPTHPLETLEPKQASPETCCAQGSSPTAVSGHHSRERAKQPKAAKKAKKQKRAKGKSEEAKDFDGSDTRKRPSETGEETSAVKASSQKLRADSWKKLTRASQPTAREAPFSRQASRSSKNVRRYSPQPNVESATSSKASRKDNKDSRTAVSSKAPSVKAPSTKATSVNASANHASAASFVSFEEVGQGLFAGHTEAVSSKQPSIKAASVAKSRRSAKDDLGEWQEASGAPVDVQPWQEVGHVSETSRKVDDVPSTLQQQSFHAASASNAELRRFSTNQYQHAQSTARIEQPSRAATSTHTRRQSKPDETFSAQRSVASRRSSVRSQLTFEEVNTGWHYDGEQMLEASTVNIDKAGQKYSPSPPTETCLRPASQTQVEELVPAQTRSRAPTRSRRSRPQSEKVVEETADIYERQPPRSMRSGHARRSAQYEKSSFHDWEGQDLDPASIEAQSRARSIYSQRQSYRQGPDINEANAAGSRHSGHAYTGSNQSAGQWQEQEGYEQSEGDIPWHTSPKPASIGSRSPNAEPHVRPPTVFAGKGWISPHPLSRSPTDVASPPQSKIMLPSQAFAHGATMTYEEWKEVQERGLKAHRNFSFTESSHGRTAKLTDDRFKFAGWGAHSTDSHRFEDDASARSSARGPASRAPTVDSEHSSHGKSARASGRESYYDQYRPATKHSDIPSRHSRVRSATAQHLDDSNVYQPPSAQSRVQTLSAWSQDHSGSKRAFDGSEASANASQMEREWEVMEEGRNVWSDVPQYDGTVWGRDGGREWDDNASRIPTSLLYVERYGRDRIPSRG